MDTVQSQVHWMCMSCTWIFLEGRLVKLGMIFNRGDLLLAKVEAAIAIKAQTVLDWLVMADCLHLAFVSVTVSGMLPADSFRSKTYTNICTYKLAILSTHPWCWRCYRRGGWHPLVTRSDGAIGSATVGSGVTYLLVQECRTAFLLVWKHVSPSESLFPWNSETDDDTVRDVKKKKNTGERRCLIQ